MALEALRDALVFILFLGAVFVLPGIGWLYIQWRINKK